MIDSKQLVWKMLIAKGYRVISEGYYGDDLDYERYCPKEYLKGVDWSKTENPHTDCDRRFNGTFSDDEYVNHLRGTLHRKGKKELWKLEFDRSLDFCEVINLVCDFINEAE